jgi:hypothetical protein
MEYKFPSLQYVGIATKYDKNVNSNKQPSFQRYGIIMKLSTLSITISVSMFITHTADLGEFPADCILTVTGIQVYCFVYKAREAVKTEDQQRKISGSHSDGYEDGCLLGYCFVLSGRSLPTFQRCLLSP